jgi:hypothetical protein
VGRDRTADTRIFSPLLYRLSYRTIYFQYLTFSTLSAIEYPVLSNRAAKIGDIPNKTTKKIKKNSRFMGNYLKKASR